MCKFKILFILFYVYTEFEVLEEVLNEIFSGTQKDRIREIKIFFNKHEVCARSDVLLININEMKAKEFFSESELMRIESFLGKGNTKKRIN